MAKTQPDEQYTPQGEKIPIPRRDDFIANVRKVIESEPPPSKFRKRPKRG